MKKYIVPSIMILENEVEPCMDGLSGGDGDEGDVIHSKQGGSNTFNFVGSFDDDK